MSSLLFKLRKPIQWKAFIGKVAIELKSSKVGTLYWQKDHNTTNITLIGLV
jgi:hypothetical protein